LAIDAIVLPIALPSVKLRMGATVRFPEGCTATTKDEDMTAFLIRTAAAPVRRASQPQLRMMVGLALLSLILGVQTIWSLAVR
jgi:hypothetical protein